MSKRKFTSDLHFGHRLMTRLRGFGDDIEAHDNYIVETWNEHVSKDDQVFILGDLTLKNPNLVPHIKRLNGDLSLILGNHDVAHPMMRGYEKKHRDTAHMFEYMGISGTLRVDGDIILMSHFPYSGDHTDEDRHSQWRLPDMGKFLLHGHTHKETKQESTNMLHVGWDAWGRPVSESEVMEYYVKWKSAKN